jgi:hypothetical protein
MPQGVELRLIGPFVGKQEGGGEGAVALGEQAIDGP